MEIVKVQKAASGVRIIVPRTVCAQLRVTQGDYLAYSINPRGFAELRKVPSAKQMTLLDKEAP